MIVDLRSDTVTRPTSAMLAAMMTAPVGDDVFEDDPSVNALQDKIAATLGFDDGSYCHPQHAAQFCHVPGQTAIDADGAQRPVFHAGPAPKGLWLAV